MLRLSGGQVESLFDEALPVEVRELPEGLARLDALLSDPALLVPIAERWDLAARERGRPTIAMASYVRLMMIRQRTGWGYETLVREVSDSLHLRRFCLIGLSERVPDESTVRKLTRRLGPDVVDELTRVVIATAQRERRFVSHARCVVIRRSWRPTCAGRRTPGWRSTPRERSRARAAGRLQRSVRTRAGCRIARAPRGDGCD